MTNVPVISGSEELRLRWKAELDRQYLIWRGTTRKTITDYARWFPVPQSTMDSWYNRGVIPGPKYLPIVAAKYPWIYEFFGLPTPKPEAVDEISALIPEDLTRRISEARAEYMASLSERGISSESPEGRVIIKETFSKHGVEFNVRE